MSFDDFKESVEKATGDLKRVCQLSLKQRKKQQLRRNLKGWKGHGLPPNPSFQKCYKPYEGQPCQAVLADGVFCMETNPCWKEQP